MPNRIVNLVGEVFIDVEIGQDCDGGVEVRHIESVTWRVRNKGGLISGTIADFSNDFLDYDELLKLVKHEEQEGAL